MVAHQLPPNSALMCYETEVLHHNETSRTRNCCDEPAHGNIVSNQPLDQGS